MIGIGYLGRGEREIKGLHSEAVNTATNAVFTVSICLAADVVGSEKLDYFAMDPLSSEPRDVLSSSRKKWQL